MIILVLVIGVLAITGYFIVRSREVHPKIADGAQSQPADEEITYLPLGDSYTIGQSVSESDRWPNQLVNRLQSANVKLNIVANPSVTGYTTQNLIDNELPLVAKLKPDFVTILIGVNDYVQDVPITTFEQHLDYIIQSVQQTLSNPKNIVLITIPDYSKTPTGAEFGNPATSTAGVIAFNAVIAQAGQKYGLPVADIFPVSQQVASDPSLIADDGLHPSGKEYTAWTNIIYQTIVSNGLLGFSQH